MEPNTHIFSVEVSGGQFKQPHIGPTINTYQDDKTTIGFSGSTVGNQTIQYIFYNEGNSEKTNRYDQASPDDEKPSRPRQSSLSDKDCIRLSDKIVLFKKKPLRNQSLVYIGEETSDITGPRPIAIKFLTAYNQENIQEAKILLRLAHHRNVVSIIHSDTYNGGPFPTMYIAMELCDTKTLGEYILEQREESSKTNFSHRQDLIRQVAEGLAFIHSQDVIHRDLKPDNILFSKDGISLKISDFGLSKELRHGAALTTQTDSRIGTDGYRAPETFHKDVISKQADVFSFGIIAHFVLTDGEHPFGNDPYLWNYNIINNVNRNLHTMPEPKSNEAAKLICACINFDPEQRLLSQNFVAHPFFGYEELVSSRDEEDELPSPENKGDNCPLPSIKRDSSTSPATEEEKYPGNSIMLFDRINSSLRAYKPSDKRWIPMHKLPKELIDVEFTPVVLGRHIYALMDNKAVFHLDLSKLVGRWTRVADMLEQHGWGPPAKAMNGYIYVIGHGYSPYPTPSCRVSERYNPIMDQWTRLKDMPFIRKSHYVEALRGYIYCFGGVDGALQKSPAVERYHVETDTWESVATMPKTLDFPPMGAVVLSDFIYVISGKDILRYDPASDSWMTIQLIGEFPFDLKRAFKMFNIDGRVYAAGKKLGRSELHWLDLDEVKWDFVEEIQNMDVIPRESAAFDLRVINVENMI